MDESYPIILSGQDPGSLRVLRRGLYTEFTAVCPDPGTIVRLSVYGEGREGYLGVMEPSDGMLRLTRRLSRRAMEGFPARIDYAAPAGQDPAPLDAPAKTPDETPERTGTDEGSLRPDEPDTDLLWFQAGDGSLVTLWEGRQYRAIPMAAWGLPLEHAVERRTIDGVEYAVFAIRSDQIV